MALLTQWKSLLPVLLAILLIVAAWLIFLAL